MTIQFDVMTGTLECSYEVDVRRLATVSSVTKSNWEKAFCIEWVWYWLDETHRWIVYSEKVSICFPPILDGRLFRRWLQI